MINEYFDYRKRLEFLDDNYNPDVLIDKLKSFVNSKNMAICVFKSDNVLHWLASLQYSLREEIGYVLWGATGKNKGTDTETGIEFKYLIEQYKNSVKVTSIPNKEVAVDINKPLFATFLVGYKGSYLLGFGLVVSVEYDLYRNFKYWTERDDIWKVRPKIKVLYLDPRLRKNISKIRDLDLKNFREDKLFELIKDVYSNKDLNIRGNQCYNQLTEEGRPSQIFPILYDFIKSKFDNKNEILETLNMYKGLRYSSTAPNKESVANSLALSECVKAPNLDLPNSFLASISNKLSDQNIVKDFLLKELKYGNILLIGPPGTGKTTVARNLAEYVSGKNCYTEKTANSLWFRRDLIGGETIENASVMWKSGLFIEAYNRAYETKTDIYTVIIDEINRADIDKAFGEWFTIFSGATPDEWKVPNDLINEIKSYDKIDEEAKKFLSYYAEAKEEPLKKIRIIATMNLVDARNLFYVGEALVRRFSVIWTDYPKNAEDVPNDMPEIKRFIDCLRRKFSSQQNQREKEVISFQFNISPAAVDKAIRIFKEMSPNSIDIDLFDMILRSTLGTIDINILNVYDTFSKDCKNDLKNSTNKS